MLLKSHLTLVSSWPPLAASQTYEGASRKISDRGRPVLLYGEPLPTLHVVAL